MPVETIKQPRPLEPGAPPTPTPTPTPKKPTTTTPSTSTYDDLRKRLDPDYVPEGAEDDKPPTPSSKVNLIQDYAKLFADISGLPIESVETFLMGQPDLVASLYSNWDITSKDVMTKLAKLRLELEQLGALGTNLGAKAGSLTQSVTTRTLSPGEAESIFKLELEWQKAQKQAPLEAAKLLGQGYTPENFRGQYMPGMEPGGIYSQALPGMDANMFKYQPTPPGALAGLTKMFQPDMNESMLMAQMAMQQALKSGISSTSNTTSTTTPMGGPTQGLPPAQLNPMIQAWMQSQQPAPQPQQWPEVLGPSVPPGLGAPSAPQPQPNILQRLFGGQFGGR